MNFMNYLAAFGLALTLTACGGGGGNAGTPSGSSATPATTASAPAATASATASTNSTVASLSINSSSSVLNADGTSTVTLKIFALTAGNASVVGATVDLSATNGVILGSPSAVTTATGATVTVLAMASNQTNRVAVITASCSDCSAQPTSTQINVAGASIALSNTGNTSLIIGGASSTLSATVKDFSGQPISDVDVSFAVADPLVLGLNAATAKTNGSGIAQVNVSGQAAGSSTVTASALGNAKSLTFTAGSAIAVLSITSPANNTVVVRNTPQVITVAAPAGATQVTFATTIGTFSNLSSSQTVAVVGGSATATLTAAQAGTATVTVVDNNLGNVGTANVSLIVSPPVSDVNKLLLNASQTTLPVSVTGGSQYSITLSARAIYWNGLSDQAVANAPVQFSMTGGPGAGEFLSPALAYTNSSGVATATFTSGTAASVTNGIAVSATIQGTAISTGVLPSNNNALLTVGGQALSVAFGPASVLGESSDKTLYIQAYSVQVTDANNNPVKDQVVTLRMRPVAFSLGSPCTITATYCSEDVNGNGSLDTAEDGTRTATSTDSAGSCPSTAPAQTGTTNVILTPPNSDGGAVPTTVITDVNGTAAFNLTYLKGSAFWIIDKLTATVSSNGTETSNSKIFRLPASQPDVDPICTLPASPYSY